MTVTPTETHYDARHQVNLEETCRRADELETAGARRQRQLAAARAIADPESHEIRADGSGETDDVDRDLPTLHVGDQVSIRDGDDGPRVPVVRDCGVSAGEYLLAFCDETVAEYNDCDPSEDVYMIKFCDRSTEDLDDPDPYPYPRSKLKLESRLHDEEVSE
ncbi:hypothetical protein [Natronoglomus mannanivorans]|uniref:Uncharacterized protein n=1 Tax=Natronoglomus mannanivorans TaxID=2979990 RepID=A0AAP2Z3N1_9EURY|nr:hypothetical protein [Halobacteria archaeon AArc-xg1-1]